MKIVIFTEGGQSIGFGHISRCLSIIEALEMRGIRVSLIIKGDNSVQGILGKRKYLLTNWLNYDLFSTYAAISDGIIIDSLQIGDDYFAKINKLYEKIIIIDDLRRIKCHKGIVIDMMVFSDRKQYSPTVGPIYLLGTRYYPLRKVFWKVDKKEIRQTIENILITFGGNDFRNLTPKILKFLDVNYPEIRKTVIVGKGYKNINEIAVNSHANTDIVINPNVNILKKLMFKADIAIASGGVTIYELARMGVPTIGVILFDNQRDNMEKWAKTGFLNLCGWWNDKKLSNNIFDNIRLLQNKEKRVLSSIAGKINIDGKGAIRIADEIIKFLAGNK